MSESLAHIKHVRKSSDALTHCVILLTLSHHVHLHLAHADVVSVLLEASKEILSKSHARILLSLLLFLLSHHLVLRSILRRCHLLLLLLHRFTLATMHLSSMGAAATH